MTVDVELSNQTISIVDVNSPKVQTLARIVPIDVRPSEISLIRHMKRLTEKKYIPRERCAEIFMVDFWVSQPNRFHQLLINNLIGGNQRVSLGRHSKWNVVNSDLISSTTQVQAVGKIPIQGGLIFTSRIP